MKIFSKYRKLTPKNGKTKKGFTLMEVLVTTLIIAVLVAIAYPMYARSIRKSRAVEGINLLSALRANQGQNLVKNGSYFTEFNDTEIRKVFRNLKSVDGKTFTTKEGYAVTLAADDKDNCASVTYGEGDNAFTLAMDYENDGVGCTGSICEGLGGIVDIGTSASDVCLTYEVEPKYLKPCEGECSGNFVWSGEPECKCVCGSTSSSCIGAQTFDESSCECICETQSCGDTEVWNAEKCKCECKYQDENGHCGCPDGQYLYNLNCYNCDLASGYKQKSDGTCVKCASCQTFKDDKCVNNNGYTVNSSGECVKACYNGTDSEGNCCGYYQKVENGKCVCEYAQTSSGECCSSYEKVINNKCVYCGNGVSDDGVCCSSIQTLKNGQCVCAYAQTSDGTCCGSPNYVIENDKCVYCSSSSHKQIVDGKCVCKYEQTSNGTCCISSNYVIENDKCVLCFGSKKVVDGKCVCAYSQADDGTCCSSYQGVIDGKCVSCTGNTYLNNGECVCYNFALKDNGGCCSSGKASGNSCVPICGDGAQLDENNQCVCTKGGNYITQKNACVCPAAFTKEGCLCPDAYPVKATLNGKTCCKCSSDDTYFCGNNQFYNSDGTKMSK